MLALWLEVRLSKRDILELYLNRVYFGGGAYGVERPRGASSASRRSELTLAEAAVLAGLLKAPSKFSPACNPAVARARAPQRAGQDGGGGLALAERGRRQAARRRALRRARSAARRDRRRVCGRCRARAPAAAGRPARPRDRSSRRPSTAACSGARRRSCTTSSTSEGRSVDASQAGLVVLDTGGRHARAGRRPLLRRKPVQSRAQGQAPARLRLQAVRLSRGARERPDARQHRAGPADPRHGLEPAQRRRAAIAATSRCARRWPCR